eukprot:TRINITY_DN23177_c0_g1_i3.p1 TRINITY_DN23177_c0_g1~~TRINITY_DN23177_c0_g1_i3.p1  ORF type:complete len:925 (-),score=154.06 TRINITY_DN23177_c0_g1_i3:100-2874(-)
MAATIVVDDAGKDRPEGKSVPSRVRVRTWGDDGENPIMSTLCGDFFQSGKNHGRKVYRKMHPDDPLADPLDIYLNFWDDQDNPGLTGWWFGSAVGGDGTWAFAQGVSADPPKTGWRIPFDGPVKDTLVVTMGNDQECTGSGRAVPSGLPLIERVHLPLLGGDTVLHGIGKSDVASAFLRGLTADWPNQADPQYDLGYDQGVFEKAWDLLLSEEPDPNAEITDRWGIGPLGQWCAKDKVHFDERTVSKLPTPFKNNGKNKTASLFPGNPERLSIGHSRSTGASKVWREALQAAGVEPGALEISHKEVYVAATSNPRKLVWLDKPCPGIVATFARFAPEVAKHRGCNCCILDIFEPTNRPKECSVALVYAAAPNSKAHEDLAPGDFLCSVRGGSSNIARLIREYNWLASGNIPANCDQERHDWWKADLRYTVEYYLSKRNFTADPNCLERRALESRGWVDLEVLMSRGRIQAAGLLDKKPLADAIRASPTLEISESGEGRLLVKPMGYEAVDRRAAAEEEAAEKRRDREINPGLWVPPPGWNKERVAAARAKWERGEDPGGGEEMVRNCFCGAEFALDALFCARCGAKRLKVDQPNNKRPRVSAAPPGPTMGSTSMPSASGPPTSFGGPSVVPPPGTPGAPPMRPPGQEPPPRPKSDDPLCWDYAKGTCNKGASCRYLHVVPTAHNGGGGGGGITLPGQQQGGFQGGYQNSQSIPGVPGTVVGGARMTPEQAAYHAATAMAGVPPPGDIPGQTAFNPASWKPGMGAFPGSPPPSPPAEEQLPATMYPGSRVLITGLVKAAHFNNRFAILMKYEEASSRWNVRMENGATLKVREANLRQLDGDKIKTSASFAARAEEMAATPIPADPDKPPKLNIGMRVMITGLVSKPEFNKRWAVVKGFNATMTRWDVQLEDGTNLRLKEANCIPT